MAMAEKSMMDQEYPRLRGEPEDERDAAGDGVQALQKRFLHQPTALPYHLWGKI